MKELIVEPQTRNGAARVLNGKGSDMPGSSGPAIEMLIRELSQQLHARLDHMQDNVKLLFEKNEEEMKMLTKVQATTEFQVQRDGKMGDMEDRLRRLEDTANVNLGRFAVRDRFNTVIVGIFATVISGGFATFLYWMTNTLVKASAK